MALETATTINQLDPANPAGPDRLAQGDDHIRLIKRALKNTFPGITGPVTLTQDFLNSLSTLVVPRGTITMWAGPAENVPAGYAICDGRTVPLSDGSGNVTTPDMRGRVPVGASTTHAVATTFGQDARSVTSKTAGAHGHAANTKAGEGAHTHTLTIAGHALTVAELPAHTHSIKGNPGTGGGALAQTSGGAAGAGPTTDSTGSGAAHTHEGAIDGSGSHNHTVTVEEAAAHAHTVEVDVTQASIAIHFIMRV